MILLLARHDEVRQFFQRSIVTFVCLLGTITLWLRPAMLPARSLAVLAAWLAILHKVWDTANVWCNFFARRLLLSTARDQLLLLSILTVYRTRCEAISSHISSVMSPQRSMGGDQLALWVQLMSVAHLCHSQLVARAFSKFPRSGGRLLWRPAAAGAGTQHITCKFNVAASFVCSAGRSGSWWMGLRRVTEGTCWLAPQGAGCASAARIFFFNTRSRSLDHVAAGEGDCAACPGGRPVAR